MAHKRTCYRCQRSKDINKFRFRSGKNSHVRRSICRKCESEAATLRQKRNRQKPEFRDKYLLNDVKRADRKFGWKTDLTRDLIKELLSKPCAYCGSSDLPMTLDRKDATFGHQTWNVNPSCMRCNYVRGEMPLEAWIALSPAIRKVTKSGLFGTWLGPGRRLKGVVAEQEDAVDKSP
jgi:hypothetical protein